MEQTSKKKTSKPYSPEFRERAVRLAMEHRDEYQSEAAALTAIAVLSDGDCVGTRPMVAESIADKQPHGRAIAQPRLEDSNCEHTDRPLGNNDQIMRGKVKICLQWPNV